ncbi:MAG: hypothetical protein IT196_17125 [Acidimicrobiales bacterium]|nr:hypothetical protein [Acidimicrobiales bacterium]
MATSTNHRAGTALVVGGTGPTGPHVVNGLLDRGYTVAILHSGRHESELIPAHVEHIHTNAFDVAAVAAALGARTFDLVVPMYGRLRDLATYFAGRCGRVISVGGAPVYRGFGWPEANHPHGMAVPTREHDPLAGPGDNPKVLKMIETEQVLFEQHPTATHLRYPRLYGPFQVQPKEWCVVRRVLDGRRRIIVPDGGLPLIVLAYSRNAAQALLTAVDRPDVAAGRIVHVTDERTVTVGQWVQLLAEGLGAEIELVGMPWELARPAWPFGECSNHHRVLSTELLCAELGHRDLTPVTDALPLTARWLADHPLERGSVTEHGLQDPFDYAAEDRLIDAWGSALEQLRPVAEAADPHWTDRYAHTSVDAKLGIDTA